MTQRPDLADLEWLEDVEGDRALGWVRERSAEAEAALRDHPVFEPIRAGIQDALEASDRIPLVTQRGDHLYSFWTDAEHERGLWRRTTWDSYRSDEPVWEVLIDVDDLGRQEGVAWQWHGAQLLRPDLDRALVTLSRGGSDADTTREFDLVTRSFVPSADGGFDRPESKGGMDWVDRDTALVFTDTGAGSMTRSGYPRTVRRWTRGTDLAEAPEVYAGSPEDMYIMAAHDPTPGFERTLVHRVVAFYDTQTFLLEPDGSTTLVEVPRSAEVGLHREWLTVQLRHDWPGTPFVSGSLLVIELDRFLRGDRDLDRRLRAHRRLRPA